MTASRSRAYCAAQPRIARRGKTRQLEIEVREYRVDPRTRLPTHRQTTTPPQTKQPRTPVRVQGYSHVSRDHKRGGRGIRTHEYLAVFTVFKSDHDSSTWFRLVLARALTCGFVLQVVHLVRAGVGAFVGET